MPTWYHDHKTELIRIAVNCNVVNKQYISLWFQICLNIYECQILNIIKETWPKLIIIALHLGNN